MRARHAARRGSVETEVIAEAATLPTRDEVNDELRSLAATLFKVADDKAERNRVLDQLEVFLGRLSAKDYPDLADSEIVQTFVERLAQRRAETSSDPPGTIYNRGSLNQYKKSWTEHDLAKSGMGLVEFEVAEPEVVVWNGMRRDYEPGVTYRDYKCFVDTMRERTRNIRLAHEHAEYMFRMRQGLSDSSIASIGTARVRGTADRGSYRPAAGLFVPEYSTSGADDTE